jgi:phosphoenolpyruvate carboxylase
MSTDEQLRREIDQLGRMFGDVIRRFAGEESFELIESVRSLARRFADGDAGVADELNQLLESLANEELRIVIRAFSTFLELANLAEDRQRVRTLREREFRSDIEPRKESLRDAVRAFREAHLSAADVKQLFDRVQIELVFTAHPTEAKRKSLRSKLRQIRGLLTELGSDQLLPAEEREARLRLQAELIKLWQTDFIRPSRPTVLQEVERGLSFQPVLWATMPQILAELRAAVAEYYPEAVFELPLVLSFGSWMGGDRDGHPFVTAEVTARTCVWLRQAALESHLESRHVLADSLSLSRRQSAACDAIEQHTQAACAIWPTLVAELEAHGIHESFRRWLRVVRWRLEKTAAVQLDQSLPEGCYRTADELADDIRKVRDALIAGGNVEIARLEVDRWLDQIMVFGFHTARLDIRQHSGVYREVIVEMWRAAKRLGDASELTEVERMRLLAETLAAAPSFQLDSPSASAGETLELFRTIRRIARNFGMAALGGHVVSMTRYPSDLLNVLWLWKWSEQTDGGRAVDGGLHLPIVPLFETISDLQGAAATLSTAFESPAYRDAVRSWGDRQIVMIGYSDSTKDGGYLAACWALQRGQIDLQEVADRYGVKLTFFHGRGGSLGRGGGPAARAILSLPRRAFDGSLRLTEQGEILAERYDDPQIAYRHLEQVLWSVLAATAKNSTAIPEGWQAIMDRLAESSYRAYRQLVDHAGFGRFFRTATPIADIESLQIASRPSRRVASDRIEDLRAIPWVFAWTQCRCLLPAWYGLGTAFGEYLQSHPGASEDFRRMYREWPFMRATIDNAVLAVAKSNIAVFRKYVALSAEEPGTAEVFSLIETEWQRTEEALEIITDCRELLDDVPWLKASIAVRNGYVDPLNLIQAELMRRAQDGQNADAAATAEEFVHIKQLVVKGIATGMRTTG